jgi:hypothetical protein
MKDNRALDNAPPFTKEELEEAREEIERCRLHLECLDDVLSLLESLEDTEDSPK